MQNLDGAGLPRPRSSFESTVEWARTIGKRMSGEKLAEQSKGSSSMWKYILIAVGIIVFLALLWFLFSLWFKKGKTRQGSANNREPGDSDTDSPSDTGDDRSDYDNEPNGVVSNMARQVSRVSAPPVSTGEKAGSIIPAAPTASVPAPVPITGNSNGRPTISNIELPPIPTRR